MKIYTKLGDKGDTSLYSGEVVHKKNQQINVCGEIDELSAYIGLFISKLNSLKYSIEANFLINVQENLFVFNSWIATKKEKRESAKLPQIEKNLEKALEKQIDIMEINLEALHYFILSGGNEVGALAHVLRTICRRVERNLAAYLLEEPDDYLNPIMIYANRLSDYFFVLARFLNKKEGIKERFWKPVTSKNPRDK